MASQRAKGRQEQERATEAPTLSKAATVSQAPGEAPTVGAFAGKIESMQPLTLLNMTHKMAIPHSRKPCLDLCLLLGPESKSSQAQ